eukprot:COSAG01_NODE_48313_length_382_cov_1.268551_2_plen_54_part_01
MMGCSARMCFALSMAIYLAMAFAPFAVEDVSATKGSGMVRFQRAVNGCARRLCG